VFDREAFLWRAVEQADLVVLDELCGRSKETELEYQAVKRLAGLRDLKPAIYVSNLPPEALRDTYDERIYSRLACGTVFKLDGKDRRFKG
jgi:DNA replication protein DnaC